MPTRAKMFFRGLHRSRYALANGCVQILGLVCMYSRRRSHQMMFQECVNQCRRERASLIDDVIAAVDIEGLAGDQPRRVVGQKGGRKPDIVDADQAACRGL